MKLFWAYLREHRKLFFASALFGAVFALSFFLYHLPMAAILYPALLCLALGLLFMGIDFTRERRTYWHLCKLQKLTSAMITSLPPTERMGEQAYQQILRALQEEILQIQTATDARYGDLADYYTAWVHQIKTPITSMRLSLQNEDTPFSRKLTSDLFQIEQYVEMALAFMRLDADTGDYVFKKYDIDAIIRQAVTKFAAEFIGRKIQLVYEPIEQNIVTDEKWLSFVLEQILSNALKYTPKGSIRIYMQQPMTLCIQDTGIGIAAEDLPRIFEKGYTGYNGRKDKRASGIGLYLCKRICSRLGADIRISSEPDQGTTVSICLEQYDFKAE